jgi:carboxyl-terminal processing protease
MPTRNLVLLIVATIGCIAAWYARERDRRGQRVNEVLTLIDAAYIKPVDGEALVAAALDGAVATLDENSTIVRGDGQQELEAALDQQYGGVGLELAIDERTGELAVAMPLPGGPAWEAGIVAGDRIKSINGETTGGLPLRDALARLRGRPGEVVTLAVQSVSSGAETRDVRLVREVVQVESVQGDRRRSDGSWEWWLEGEPDVAFVRVTGFGERTAAELDSVLQTVAAGPTIGEMPQPPRGLVIDLRGNPGGLVTAAVDVCDRFLDDGVIVSTCGRHDDGVGSGVEPPLDVRRATPGAVVRGLPIAILVDDLTASAAEIVAACLQDHRRATIVGSRTFGKGTVQSILPLSGGGLLKLTTAEYLRPDGRSIHRSHDDVDEAMWGVVPDDGYTIVPSSDSLERLARWRKHRDAHPSAVLPGHVTAKPLAIDEVLARAIDAFPPASPPRPDLRGEEETPRDTDESSSSGA